MKELKTMNYGWFKELKGVNVPVNRRFFSEPIIVNEKFEIIDGVDRFRKWKELTRPIRYIQINGLGIKEAILYAEIQDSK